MIFGSIRIHNDALITHRDSYKLSNISVVSVRRPLIAPASMIGGGLSAFGILFADLLYIHEIISLVGIALVLILIGLNLGQLKLLSRDLRGSELIDALWGSYADLNLVRTNISGELSFAPRKLNKGMFDDTTTFKPWRDIRH